MYVCVFVIKRLFESRPEVLRAYFWVRKLIT